MKKIIAILITTLLCGCSIPQIQEVAFTEPVNIIEETQITITYAGDCTLGTDVSFGGITLPVEVENQNKDYSYFFKNVQPYFATDDLTIVNFEGTLTDRGVREQKTFAFRGKPEYTEILKQGSVEAVTLANNHSRDYGEVSLADTRTYLENAGIIWFENLNTRIVDVKGIKVGLIGLYALNGSAEGNLPKAMEQVKDAQLKIVEIHWGIEGKNYPTADQIALAHKAIDLGADVVIGHHPHVLQGIERYKDKLIAYSMGNFCFGGNQNPRDKDTMLISQTFTFTDGHLTGEDYKVVPCSISSVTTRNNYQPTPVTDNEKIRIADKIKLFSQSLSDEEIKFETQQDSDKVVL